MALPRPLRWALQLGEYDPGPRAVPAPDGPVGAVSAEPALIRVYDAQGAVALVAPEEVDAWLAKGFRVTRRALRPVWSALPAQFAAAHRALDALLGAVERDGAFDPADEAELAAAQAACAAVAEGMVAILVDVPQAFAVKQPEGVLVARGGRELRVDPNQVAAFRADGWEVVGG